MAAERGNADGQFNLGLCYAAGKGVEQNYKEAVRWFTEAAEQGEPDSMYQLARCYGAGLGVDVDDDKSLHYLIESAKLGWKPAIEALQEMRKG